MPSTVRESRGIDDAVVEHLPAGERGQRFAFDLIFDGFAQQRVLLLRRTACRPPAAAARRTIDITPASCCGPITAVLLLGQMNTNRGL